MAFKRFNANEQADLREAMPADAWTPMTKLAVENSEALGALQDFLELVSSALHDTGRAVEQIQRVRLPFDEDQVALLIKIAQENGLQHRVDEGLVSFNAPGFPYRLLMSAEGRPAGARA